ncbi:similar to TRICHOME BIREFRINGENCE-LIKE 35 [Actinidia rufa]|uniref:Similar to TRICHOME BIREFRINGENCE-LIKE 35 n=1 Tax=Actinidia rufa TaxID=165716 RepID=A0A7J0E7F3_9ERIC|nr:similar to TRICHOME BIREFRINGENCE-LIKE 35 [Actinidia rufa]
MDKEESTKALPVVLDRFSTCRSTVKYSGRKAGRAVDTQELDRPRGNGECDLFSGKWVFDNSSYPLYNESDCPYMSDQLACHKHGRPDMGYQYWRWQPHNCNMKRWKTETNGVCEEIDGLRGMELAMGAWANWVASNVDPHKKRVFFETMSPTHLWFNAKAMLERLRGKRLVFVGDSITRNQWASMVCLLESSISPELKSVTTNGSITAFKIKDYNASIEHYWSPYLVESTSDHPVNHHFSQEQILRVHAIEKHARHWNNADILVFNSHRWWTRPKFKVLGEDWGKATGENCYNETEPILKEGYHGSDLYPGLRQMVENAINELKRKGLTVQMIDITQLSNYRKDAHVYRNMWGHMTKEQIANPKSHADCIHWCIPGVPDTWNELLYVYIFHF